MKRKKPSAVSIKWRVFLTISILIAAILAFLWIFQIFLLEPFYLNIKENQVKSAGRQVAESVNDDDILTRMEEISRENQSCIVITDEMGYVLYNVDALPNCVIHRMRTMDFLYAYHLTEQNGGIYMEKGEKVKEQDIHSRKFDVAPRAILYTEIVRNQNGSIRLILVNSNIESVAATQKTLEIQLIWITIIVIALALGAALFLSFHIAKPISKLNTSAKRLGNGHYDTVFAEDGYREIQELAKTLNYASTELGKLDRYQKELLANISHDLRTPLTMIIGYGEIMRDLPGENNPENVQVIIDEAARLSSLVNDVLDISKLQSGNLQMNMTVFNLTQSIEDILQRYEKMSEYNITFSAENTVYVKGDVLKLSQVLYNLMNNAITYTGADKKIDVVQKINGTRVRITISDTGEGIDPERLQDIWNRYYKVDKAHKRAQIGTGLGLSIVKTILDLHPGTTYGVNSKIGEGSSFWFEMEIQPSENT